MKDSYIMPQSYQAHVSGKSKPLWKQKQERKDAERWKLDVDKRLGDLEASMKNVELFLEDLNYPKLHGVAKPNIMGEMEKLVVQLDELESVLDSVKKESEK